MVSVDRPQQRKNMRPLELLVTAGLLREGERLHYRSKDGEIKLYGTLQYVVLGLHGKCPTPTPQGSLDLVR